MLSVQQKHELFCEAHVVLQERISLLYLARQAHSLPRSPWWAEQRGLLLLTLAQPAASCMRYLLK